VKFDVAVQGIQVNAQHAFVSVVLGASIIGATFLGVSLGHAVQFGNLALWGQHPLFASGMASLVTVLLGWVLVVSFRRSGAGGDNSVPHLH